MPSTIARDHLGSLVIQEPQPGVLEVIAQGKLSSEVGAAFPRYALEAASRAPRCAVYLDVRGLQGFDGAVRAAWVETVLAHRARLDEVVVLSSSLLVTLSARAASVALAAVGVRFDVVTDERVYVARRSARLGGGAVARSVPLQPAFAGGVR